MSDLGFPLKDLARRRFQTILTMVGLILCTATTVFLVTFGGSLGFQVSLVTGEKLTSGFSYIFSLFIVIISFLNFLAGVLVTSFLVSTTMSERIRDIGIMKATGCSANSAFSYFLTELSIIIFTSCAAGALLGILARFICISLLNILGFSISQKPVNLWVILLIFVAFALASHILGVRPIRKAIKVKPAEALSPLFQLGTTSGPKGPASSKLGLTFKVAYRSLMRRRSATIQAIICLSVVLALTTVTVAGGMVANQTTQGYVERAIGRDVILVGHPNITRQYVDFLSQFFEAKPMEQINYSSPEYRISEPLISKLNSTIGVHVDPRLILEADVTEVQGTIPIEDPPYILFIGDRRHAQALIIGVDPKQVINDWLIVGRVLNSADVHSAVIGDSLAYEKFDNAMKQSAFILGNKTEIVGVCLDPLNKGYVVYMPIKALSEQPNYNLLFLKVEPSKRSEIIAEIREETGWEPYELNEVLDKHLTFLNRIWSLVMVLPLSSLVTATLCLLSYMMLSITGQQRELGIMRALGAKPKTIMKTIFTQALLIVLASGAIGITVGFAVTWLFLIPEAVVSLTTLASVIEWLVLALSLICLTSLYPALRATKKSIAGVISQP